jgi:hypothetical protein
MSETKGIVKLNFYPPASKRTAGLELGISKHQWRGLSPSAA